MFFDFSRNDSLLDGSGIFFNRKTRGCKIFDLLILDGFRLPAGISFDDQVSVDFDLLSIREQSMKIEDKTNILLVDDQPVNLMILEKVLKNPGYYFFKAASGLEALNILQDKEIALILLDVRMPVMDGFETAQKIRASEKCCDIPIIFITGAMKDENHIARGYSLNAVDYVLKPFDRNMLRTRVSLLAELYRKRIQVQKQAELLRQSETQLKELLKNRSLELEVLEKEITERIRFEEELREVRDMFNVFTDQIPGIAFIKDQDSRLVFANQYMKETFDAGKWLGRPISDYYPPDIAESLIAADKKALAEGPIVQLESLPDKNGTIRYWRTCKFPIRREDKPPLLGCVAIEITDLRRTEEMLEKRNSELKESNRELDDFAYIVSHDLREPLRGIHNFSTFLLEDYAEKLDQTGKSMLKTLIRLSKRLEDQIAAILQYSRVGRVKLAVEDTDLDAVLHEVLDLVKISLDDHGAEIYIPSPLPVVRCDRIRIAEVFQNLIINAMKYNDKPKKLIEIGFTGMGNYIFYVRDNGIGISEKHMEKIFQIFKRLHGKDKYGGGTGAGLSIVKKIIDRHGGRVWAESAPGEGSAFYFTLSPE
jgi:PAS domain S-box-containing protein